MNTLRPEVMAFAQAMEAKLQANDHKGGWQDAALSYLLRRLNEEVNELISASQTSGLKGVLEEAADVGNFAMMVADICGGLVYPKSEVL